jgi:hypothetical protein
MDGPAEQFRLGVDIMSGADATADVGRGIQLVEQASDAGYAAASELRAVFEAMGVLRPQRWDRAFDWLAAAARQGSQAAQRQLLILADNEQPSEIPAAPSAEFWAEVRVRISIERLLRHGDRRAVCNRPRIRVIDGFATKPECDWLIERARSRLKPALIFDMDGEHKVDPNRSNSGTDFQVVEMDVVMEVIRSRISAAVHVPVAVFELTQILHYAVGQEFRIHYDYLDADNPSHRRQLEAHGQRIATFLLYLNDDFDGGETEFPKAGVRFRGKTGDAIFWANLDQDARPEPLSLHAGLPPTAGEKWILSQWIRDRAAGPPTA